MSFRCLRNERRKAMTDNTRKMLLRLYTDENAHVGERRVVDEIVRRARGAGLAGATALRGDRKSVGEGKGVAVGVGLGGCSISKKKQKTRDMRSNRNKDENR